jgi:hypothetical protein
LQILRKIARFIVPVFLLVVICFITNTTINQHYHKLACGIVVKHAHPFSKSNPDKPFQDHQHSSSELLLLDQMSNTIFWIYLFVFLQFPLKILFEIIRYPLVILFKNQELYFLRNYHAPPESSYWFLFFSQ